MKQLILLPMFLIPVALFAQQGLSASGGNTTNATGSVSYTAGQTAFLSATTVDGDLNEGIQQPYEFLVLSVSELEADQHIELYPNPTADLINLRLTGFNEQSEILLYDQQGKLLEQQTLIANETQLSLAKYASGSYRLVLIQQQKSIKSYQIIKNH